MASLIPAVFTGAHAFGMVGILVFDCFASVSLNLEEFCLSDNSRVSPLESTKVSGTTDFPGMKPFTAAIPFPSS